MKTSLKHLLLVCAGSILAALSTNHASATCTNLPSGAVAWWRAESNTVDTVGVNDGVLAGNTTWGQGHVNTAFAFDGDSDAVPVCDSKLLQLQNFTIEGWVKRDNASVTSLYGNECGVIFSYGYGGYGFGMYDDGGLFLSRIGIDNVSVSASITNTSYHHVAVTKSGSYVTFYVDGFAIFGSTNYDTTYTFDTCAAIGARGDDLTSSFLGRIDELTIYNRALSGAEIGGIHNAGTSGKCVPSTPSCVTVTNMVAWWKGQANANDSIGSHHGIEFGVGHTAAKVGQGFSFDGDDYVLVTNITSLNFTNAFTVEAWVKFDAEGNKTIIAKGIDQDVPVDWALTINESQLRPHVQINNSWYYFDCDTIMMQGCWYHVAMVYDGSAIKGYVNGVLDGEFEVSGTVKTSGHPARIGVYSAADNHAYFSGLIDELSVYNRALSAGEIQSIFSVRSVGKCNP